MTQHNTLNVKLSNSQLNKLKSAIKKSFIKFCQDSNNENNFPHTFLLTNTQVSKLRKAFPNNSSANMKLSKTQLHNIVQSGGFLGRLLEPLLKTGLSLRGNVLKTLAKSLLIPLELMAVSTTDAATHKKMRWSCFTTLIIFNEEINDIMKTVKSLEESGLLIKDIKWNNKKWSKRTKGRISWNLTRKSRC